MDYNESLSISKDTQKFVKDLSELPPQKCHQVLQMLSALEKQQYAEASLENKRGWRYMWQRTPKPYLLMLAYFVFLAPVGSFGYQAFQSLGDNFKTAFLISLTSILVLPLLIVFYLSYQYIKNKKLEEISSLNAKNDEEELKGGEIK